MIHNVFVVEHSKKDIFEQALAAEIDAIQRNGGRAEVQMVPDRYVYRALVLHQDA